MGLVLRFTFHRGLVHRPATRVLPLEVHETIGRGHALDYDIQRPRRIERRGRVTGPVHIVDRFRGWTVDRRQ
jgi:hypothetical protein